MAKARKHLISLDATSYYHCTSRCVRRAFLCGFDRYTNTSYEHRRAWVEERILLLGSIFAIDVCAYAVMSNHHHIVLHINKALSLSWTEKEVCRRWHQLYKGTALTQKFLKDELLCTAEMAAVKQKLNEWRLALCDISAFMKALNEPIARRANAEDQCTGRFFESRYKSQALLDEKALAACMAYVDLNPVRANMAETPEASDYTSIKKRLHAAKQTPSIQPRPLAPFVGNPREPMPAGLPFHLQDYVNLVDITGRAIRENKRGYIDNALPPILERLAISPKQWWVLTTRFESRFNSFVGAKHSLQKAMMAFQLQRRPNLANCEALLN